MSGPSIRVTRDFYAIRVFINDLLHLRVPAMGPVGLHSWVKPTHSIELIWPGGSMTAEYDTREKWELVLCGLEGVL